MIQVALAHYHGDSKPLDLLILDTGTSDIGFVEPASVSILTGNGDGTFGPPTVVFTGPQISQILTDDFNGDGKPDLTVMVSSDTNGVTTNAGVLRFAGNGDGTFGSGVLSNAGSGAGYGVYADINGDGRPDLIYSGAILYFAGMNVDGLTVSLSNSDGTLATPIVYPGTEGGFLLAGNFLGGNAINVVDENFLGTSFFRNLASPAPAPDFTITSSSSSLNITRGGSGTTQISVAANSALSGTVTFTCSGLPSESTCAFSPASASASTGQTVTTTLTIKTTAPSQAAVVSVASRRHAGGGKIGGQLTASEAGIAIVGMACCIALPLRRRRLGMPWLCTLLIFASLGLGVTATGCSGGTSSKGSSDPGTPTGTVTVTVTATATSGGTTVTHSVPVTVTVQ